MRRRNRLFALLLSLCLCFCALCLAPASAEAVESPTIDRVLCSLNYPPVALMDLQYVSVSSSSKDCAITSSYWTDVGGSQVTDSFKTGTYTLNVNYAANEGKTFLASALGYINNKNDGVSVTVSEDGKTAVLRKTFTAEIWTPTVVKQPTGEKVELGGWCSFATSSTYVESYEWFFESADREQVMPAANAPYAWQGVTITGENTDRLVIHHVTEDMDGWRVFCRHWSVDHLNYAETQRASITVINIPTPAPTPEFTPVPLEVPSPTPIPTPAELPELTTEPAPAVVPAAEATPAAPRAYSYTGDSNSHWRVYTDNGETGEREEHLYVWHETRAATPEQPGEETGVCSICGQTVTRTLNYEGPESRSSLGIAGKLGLDGFSDMQLLLLGGSALCVLLLILSAALSPRKARGRRRR